MAEHVVIIGSGPAGFSAAIYAARANLQPILFEGNPGLGDQPLGQLALTTEVENYAGFPSGLLHNYLSSAIAEENKWMLPPLEEHAHAVTGPELMNLMRQQALNFGTRIVTDNIEAVDFSKRPLRVKPAEGDWIDTHTVIVSTGAKANYLGLPTEEMYKNRGVSACAVCDGALPRFRNKPLVVVGGGDSAVEEATYLAKYGSVVYLVVRRDELRASKIMQQRALSHPKMVILWNAQVDEVLGDDHGGLSAVKLIAPPKVRTHDGAIRDFSEWRKLREIASEHPLVLPAAGLFIAIGHTPNTTFLNNQVEISDKGYIKLTTPFRTYTSVAGVYAAGDVADDYYRQAITSAGTGCMAALDAERYLASKGL